MAKKRTSNGEPLMVATTAGDLARMPARAIIEQAKDPTWGLQGVAPNFGQPVVPHIFTASGRSTTYSHVYRPSDEAIRDSLDNARFMRNDCMIRECLDARQRAVSLLKYHITPEDERSTEQKQLADAVTKIVARSWNFLDYRFNLLHAIWYGRYGIQHQYGRQQCGGQWRTVLRHWLPINGDKLVFRFDDGTYRYADGQVGIRIGAGFQSGTFMNRSQNDPHIQRIQATDQSLAYFLYDWERHLIAIHKHQIEDGAFEDPLTMGSIHGVGIRSAIYQTWLMMSGALGWLLEFAERSALGIEIWRYPMSSDAAQTAMLNAAQSRDSSSNIVLVPVPQGTDHPDTFGVDRIEPGMAGAETIYKIINDLFGHRIKRYILGQTLTSEAEGSGLGSSGISDLHKSTYNEIVRYDAAKLSETMTHEYVRQVQLLNFPRSAHIYLQFHVDTESADSTKQLEAVKDAFEMGMEVKEDEVAGMIGVSVPKPGDRTLSLAKLKSLETPPASANDQEANPIAAELNRPAPKPEEAAEPPSLGDGTDSVQHAASFDESEHPRASDGKFGDKSAGDEENRPVSDTKIPQYSAGGFHRSAVNARRLSQEAHEFSETPESSRASEISVATNDSGRGEKLRDLHRAAARAHDQIVAGLNQLSSESVDAAKKQSLAFEASLHQDAANAHNVAGDYFNKYYGANFGPHSPRVQDDETENHSVTALDPKVTNEIASRIRAVSDPGWYTSLFMAALERSKNHRRALEVADDAYADSLDSEDYQAHQRIISTAPNAGGPSPFVYVEKAEHNLGAVHHEAPELQRVFVFGDMADDGMRERILGHQGTAAPASLYGYVAEDGEVRRGAGTLEGVTWDATPDELAALDEYEHEPRRSVTLENGERAQAYLPKGGMVKYAADFLEEDHPRATDGRFGDKPGEHDPDADKRAANEHWNDAAHSGKGKEYKLTLDGSQLPEHLKNLRLPPAWTDIRINTHPDADLVATGSDAKGRKQYVYSDTHAMRQAAAKFGRISELVGKADKIEAEIEEAVAEDNEEARVAQLIFMTGIRPGSDTDTKAEKQAYGATTLRGRHIVAQEDGTAMLQFVGKKGVDLSIPVRDKDLAAELIARAEQAGPEGKIFKTDDAKLRYYVHTLDGGSFKPKDFRTLRGTSIAADEVRADSQCCKTLKEYKKRVKEVATRVSQALGNTPLIALQSYIDPTVFSKWRPGDAA